MKKIIGVDPASKDGDYTAEVEAVKNPDGTITIIDVRRYRDTIDLTATDITDQKQIERK